MYGDEPYITHDESIDICLTCPLPKCNNCLTAGMDFARQQRTETLERIKANKETEGGLKRGYHTADRPLSIQFKEMYTAGMSLPHISEKTGLPIRTCYAYRQRFFGKKKKGEAQ